MKKIVTAAATVVLMLGLAAAAACSPQPGGDSAKGDAGDNAGDEIAVSFEWSPESDCGICHGDQKESYGDGESLAALHADQTCLTCHADETGLIEAHEGATAEDKAPSRLKKTDVEPKLCESCHARDEIAAATAECAVLTDSEGTVANPHSLADTAEHNDIECADCHDAHAAEPAASAAQTVCYNCHHMEVYECGTCHR